MGGRQAERVRDCHSRGRREFLYQREGWTSPLRGFLAARIFLLHRKKVSGVTGARQPRHFRSLHGRLRRVASRLPPSATLQRRQRAQRRAPRETSCVYERPAIRSEERRVAKERASRWAT